MQIRSVRRLRLREREIFHIFYDYNLISLVTMKFLSDKQEEDPNNFEEKYGFTFRDYEIFTKILTKFNKEDETYKSDLKSALNALKNSKNEYIQKIYEFVPESNIDIDDFERVMQFLDDDENPIRKFEFIMDIINEHMSSVSNSIKLNILMSNLAQTNHTPTNVYIPSCKEATTITNLKDFKKATLFEEDEKYYSLALQNIILHEVDLNKITLENQEINPDKKYDTIISTFPIRKRGQMKLSESIKTMINHLEDITNLIEKLDENAKFVLPAAKNMIVRKDAYDLRKNLIENNLLDAVIQYQSRFGPDEVTILVINKARTDENVLFIKPKSVFFRYMSKINEEIIQCYSTREIIPKFSNLVTKEKIVENDYNFNPNRYVNTLDYEHKNLEHIIQQQSEYTNDIRQLDKEIDDILEKLINN